MNSANVTAAKPKVGGAIFAAPVGTTLPTDATTALNSAFKDIGYASEDGVTNTNAPESDSIKAWGGDTVLTLMTGREDKYNFTLIEATNLDALKVVYGASNVTGTLSTGIAIAANAGDLGEHSFVIEMVLKDNAVKRVVIPRGRVSNVGEISYTDSDAVGYQTEITCETDSNGNTHYEYIKAASQSS